MATYGYLSDRARQRLRLAVSYYRLSDRAVAARAGLNHQTGSRRLNSDQYPFSLDHLAALADAVGVPPDLLVADDQAPFLTWLADHPADQVAVPHLAVPHRDAARAAARDRPGDPSAGSRRLPSKKATKSDKR